MMSCSDESPDGGKLPLIIGRLAHSTTQLHMNMATAATVRHFKTSVRQSKRGASHANVVAVTPCLIFGDSRPSQRAALQSRRSLHHRQDARDAGGARIRLAPSSHGTRQALVVQCQNRWRIAHRLAAAPADRGCPQARSSNARGALRNDANIHVHPASKRCTNCPHSPPQSRL